MKIMLVGGPIDGKELHIEEHCSLCIPIQKETPCEFDGKLHLRTPTYIEYVCYTFNGTVKPKQIYVVKGMSADEIIDRLIANYRP